MIYITCTMAAWDFADIYTRSPWTCGPRALGVYISKIPCSHGITITLTLCASPTLKHSLNANLCLNTTTIIIVQKFNEFDLDYKISLRISHLFTILEALCQILLVKMFDSDSSNFSFDHQIVTLYSIIYNLIRNAVNIPFVIHSSDVLFVPPICHVIFYRFLLMIILQS